MWSNSWKFFFEWNWVIGGERRDAPFFLRNQLISALLPRRMSGDLPWAGRSCNCHMRTGFNRNLSSNSGDRQRMHRAASAASRNFSIPQPRDATIHHPRPVESVLERPDVKTAGEILATPFNNLRFKTLSTGQIARRLAVCEESSTTPFGRFVRFTRKL